jgi:dolichol kinase
MPTRPETLFGDTWPQVDHLQFGMMVGVPIALTALSIFILRVIWPAPAKPHKEPTPTEETPLKQHTVIYVHEGDQAPGGDYSQIEDWKQTFDMVFLSGMMAVLLGLCICTTLFQPEIWHDGHFWLLQLPKVLVMVVTSLGGGWVCRMFCKQDENGYIITNKDSRFKVNYTRKLQHFAAYTIPLFVHTGEKGPLALIWGYWFTLLGFLILIKPLREASDFFMLQFNSLDRPEDRPHTLKWIVAGNVVPGQVLIVIFRYLLNFTNQGDLVLVFIMITGIGDGLAEPVGIAWGRHKYWTSGLFSERKYQRSYEGSACILVSGFLFCSCYWYAFSNPWQMWTAAIIISPAMTYAEATSPHTIDTPFLMGVGGLLLLLITHTHVSW